MKQQNWKRTEYTSWEEAFRGLSPIIRQQSVRVAAYTQVLFVSACKLKFGKKAKEGESRMRGQYADLAYKCGMYHQLGKALVPPEYQIWQKDFTEEETAVYKKYTTDGRLLVASLQEKAARAKEKRQGVFIEEFPTKNIPWLMIRESCEQHMERWDGTGYPAGKSGDEISPIAQIVGLAKELDRIASETKSEDPYKIAVETIKGQAGSAFSEELIAVLEDANEECFEVYNKYIAYTMKIPKTVSLIDKRRERPMGLKYRPMITDKHKTVTMYEATPWFAGITGEPDVVEGVEDLRGALKRLGLVENMSRYFLYEATDALVRADNCKLSLDGILLNMIPEFYTVGTQLQKLNQVFEDQQLDKKRLWLTIPEQTLLGCSKSASEVIARYIKNGYVLVVDGYRPNDLPYEKLAEMGISHVRVAPELYMEQETANTIRTLEGLGVTVLAGGADTPEILKWLIACGVKQSSGTMTGRIVDEDELIIDSLAREQQ